MLAQASAKQTCKMDDVDPVVVVAAPGAGAADAGAADDGFGAADMEFPGGSHRRRPLQHRHRLLLFWPMKPQILDY